jgi:hypothetical protein
MTAGYWFVQPYRVGGSIEAEQRCADCAEMIVRIEQFKSTNTDPNIRLRVHVPSQAADEERARVSALGEELI